MADDFSDAALVLVGHGSKGQAHWGLPVSEQAARLQGRGLFAQVLEAFLNQEPGLEQALQAAVAARVFVVPMFSCEGYFTQQVVPRHLGLDAPGQAEASRIVRRGGQRLYYCAPVGTHDRMGQVVLDCAQAVLAKYPAEPPGALSQATLCLVGHGTLRNPHSRKTVEQLAAQIAAMNRAAAVLALFLEEEPRVQACYRLAATRDLVVVPFFIGQGEHVCYDIPLLLGEPAELVEARYRAGQPAWPNPTQRHGKRLWYAHSVGADPGLAEVILDRVRQAAGWVTG